MWIAAMAVAHACSCAGAGPIEGGVAQAEYGFYGEVVARGDHNWMNRSTARYHEVDIEVIEPFMGVAKGDVLQLTDGLGGGDCGFGVRPGERIFVLSAKGHMGGICGYSRRMPVAEPQVFAEVRRAVAKRAVVDFVSGRYAAPWGFRRFGWMMVFGCVVVLGALAVRGARHQEAG